MAVESWMITFTRLNTKQSGFSVLVENWFIILCQTLTHEEVKDGHVHNVQQSCATVIRWSLFDLLTVVWVHFPSEETFNTFNFFASDLEKCLLNPFPFFCYVLLDLSVFLLRRNKIEIKAVYAAGNCQWLQ